MQGTDAFTFKNFFRKANFCCERSNNFTSVAPVALPHMEISREKYFPMVQQNF